MELEEAKSTALTESITEATLAKSTKETNQWHWFVISILES